MRPSMMNVEVRSTSSGKSTPTSVRSWSGQMQRGFNPYAPTVGRREVGFRGQAARNVRDADAAKGKASKSS